MSISRVSSTASELNDFTVTSEGKKLYNVSKSRLVGLINWVHVLRAYLPYVSYLAFGSMVCLFVIILYEYNFDFKNFLTKEIGAPFASGTAYLGFPWQVWVLVSASLIYIISKREKSIYLLDFATFEPPNSWRLSQEQLLDAMRIQGSFTEDSLDFMSRMLKQSGVGPATAWPPGIVQCLEGKPADSSVEASRKEAEIVIFDCVRQVLESSGTKARDIDILVINCSLFSPTPSLCSMVVNEFGLKPDISSYNLSGMGCSAGIISLELAKNVMMGRPNSVALIVSTEIITPNLYHGNERPFLLQNTLFRCGGAAFILSNKWTDAFRARFKLLHCLRTQYVSEDSFGCVYETEDESGKFQGVRLSKDIVKVAGRAMEKNLTSLGPYVLPLSEQIKTAIPMAVRILSKQLSVIGIKLPRLTPYIPDFKRGIDHFCIHAGGRGVIDGIEKNLNLNPEHVEASRHTLYTYGNTSSSSIWYEMKYISENMNLRRGQRVLQLAFGSGFKCNTAVWLALNNPSRKKRSKVASKEKKSQ